MLPVRHKLATTFKGQSDQVFKRWSTQSLTRLFAGFPTVPHVSFAPRMKYYCFTVASLESFNSRPDITTTEHLQVQLLHIAYWWNTCKWRHFATAPIKLVRSVYFQYSCFVSLSLLFMFSFILFSISPNFLFSFSCSILFLFPYFVSFLLPFFPFPLFLVFSPSFFHTFVSCYASFLVTHVTLTYLLCFYLLVDYHFHLW